MALRGGAAIQGSRWGAGTPTDPSGNDGGSGGGSGGGGGGGGSTWKPDAPASSAYKATGTVTWSTAVGAGSTIDTLFHTTTQKVVRTASGTQFAVRLTQDNTSTHSPSTWELKKSTDDGVTWSVMWNSNTQGDPQSGICPGLELDENENLYVIANYYPSVKVVKMYTFTAASGYSTAGVTANTIISTHGSGKWGICLDQTRKWIWIVLWADTTNPNLYAFDYTGTQQYSRQVFKVFTSKWTPSAVGVSDKHGEPAYPAIFVEPSGRVHLAWNNMACEAGDFTGAQLSYYDVRYVFSDSTTAQFQAGTETWQGPNSGVSGTPSNRTLPFAGDDSGTQAETAYPICKLSNTTDEFIPASNASYGFGTGLKYNFNRLFGFVANNGAAHFYYESEASNAGAIQHHSYARFRLSTFDIADGQRRTPDWHWDVTTGGDRAGGIVGQGGGVFVQDTTCASRLYFVTRTSRDLDLKILVLRSDDGGLTWWQYALSSACPTGGSNGLLLVQAYRWVATDGTIAGIVQLGDSPNTVYTFKVSPA